MLILCHWLGDHDESASSIYEQLCAIFGRDDVFDANVAVAAGSVFRDDIDERVRLSEALVVLITPDWIEGIGAAARRGDKRQVLRNRIRSPGRQARHPRARGKRRLDAENGTAPADDPGHRRAVVSGNPGRSSLVGGNGRSRADDRDSQAGPLDRRSRSGPRSRPHFRDPADGPAWRTVPAAAFAASPCSPPSLRSAADDARCGRAPPGPSAPPPPARSGMLGTILHRALRTLWAPKPAEPRAEAVVLLAASAPRLVFCPAPNSWPAPAAYVVGSARLGAQEAGRTSASLTIAVVSTRSRPARGGSVCSLSSGSTGAGAGVTPPEVRFRLAAGALNLAGVLGQGGSRRRATPSCRLRDPGGRCSGRLRADARGARRAACRCSGSYSIASKRLPPGSASSRSVLVARR